MLNFIKNLVSKFFIKKEIILIDSLDKIEFLISHLSKQSLLGLDTEFDWRNTYLPKLSLIQISSSTKIFLLDALKIKDFSFLRSILEDKNKKIIMHASRSDTTVLSSNLNIYIENVFDIQIAEKIIFNNEIKNYGSIVKNHFNLDLEQSQTNSNWLKRPISVNQISYAAEDVSFLLPIYSKQLKILKKIGKLNSAFDQSYQEAKKGNTSLHITRLKKLKKATDRQRKIFLWREEKAFSEDVPPSYIISDKNLNRLYKLNSKDANAIKKLNSFLGNSTLAEDFKSQFL